MNASTLHAVLDRADQVGAHRLLVQKAHPEHGVTVAVRGDAPLGLGRRVLHQHHDDVVAEERLRLRRPAAEEALVAPHDRVGDLLVDSPAGAPGLIGGH
jgi:hypothetical protein